MKKLVLIYDDSSRVNDRIKSIIGDKSYGEIVLKRKKLFSRVYDACINSKVDVLFKKIDSLNDLNDINIYYDDDIVFFHLLSYAAVFDDDKLVNIIEKLPFINKNTSILMDDKIIGIIFNNKNSYLSFINDYKLTNKIFVNNFDKIVTDAFIDLTNYNNLLSYISSGFDARFFNSLQGDQYVVTKKSSDKNKMLMEYKYYWLLPDEMKSWMVMPYNYQEFDDYASYTMERMPMTDIAIMWTHGAISIDDFEKIMDKIFYFYKIRSVKKISKDEYIKQADKLYVDKVIDRIKKLKKLDAFKNMENYVLNGTNYNGIDEIIDKYLKLYKKISDKKLKKLEYISVVGHGDTFFANMLYSKETNMLRLIDPKGAVEENDLWTNPYYDIAKLSHSICGEYDFFNTNMYNIDINTNMKLELTISFDNSSYVDIFKKYLAQNNFDYSLVRLYETSLFLSMLPLHIDNPHKVLGFILNAINILEELEDYV